MVCNCVPQILRLANRKKSLTFKSTNAYQATVVPGLTEGFQKQNKICKVV